MQDRNAVVAPLKPYSMTEGVEAMDVFLGRQAEQQRLGMGFAADGSGGLNLDTAPEYVKRALYRGDGDKVIKLDPQAGLPIAPGVSGKVRVLVQVKMREIGIEMSYDMVDKVVQMAYHLVPISDMQSKGSSQCRIGEFTVKTNQPADQKMQRMGPAILELLDNLILTRQLFDPTSVHTIDLQVVLAQIKHLKNRMLRVDDVWEALTTQFQCFHQLIQNWAKSSTTAVMPRLTGVEGMQAATSQWQRAEFTAARYRTIDPAWSRPTQGMDGASATAASTPGDHPLSPQIIAAAKALAASLGGGGAASTSRTTSAGRHEAMGCGRIERLKALLLPTSKQGFSAILGRGEKAVPTVPSATDTAI
jgi:hypothetical protein